MEYEEFREDYIKRHPASVPELEGEISPYPRWLKFAALLMFLAAALLSAVHTIPVVYAGIPADTVISESVRAVAANASILAFELGILLSAFLMMVKNSLWLAWLLLGTMFAGTVIANVESISRTGGNDVGSALVTMIFGCGIPIIALAAGKLFVNIYTAERKLKVQARETYREALKQLDATINSAYSRAYGAPVSSRSTKQEKQPKQSKRRDSPSMEQALAHLRAHPEDVDRPSREVAAALGGAIGHATIFRAQHQLKNGHNGNGNHE